MATNKDFIVKNGLSVGEDISVSGSVTSNLQFDDSVQLQLGTDSDLLIYHDGTDSYIDAPQSGHLYIQNQIAGKDLRFRVDDGNGSLADFMVIDSSTQRVKIKVAGSNIIEAKSSGIDITGNAVLTGELRGPASFVIDPAAIGDNTGEVVIKGDLTVEGTTTTINSTTLNVDDLNITLASGAASTAAADGAGITIDGAGAIFAWNDAQGSMTLNKELRLDNNKGIFFQNAAANATLGIKADTNDQITFRQNGNWDRLVIKNSGVDVSGVLTASGNIVTTANVSAGTYTGITLGGSLTGDYTDAKVQYGNSFSGTPAQGHFFFDALNQKLKVYTGSAFVDAVPAGGGGGGGSGSSDATATFRKYTYTLTGTTNAISGMEDDEVTTGDFISGRLYEITAVGDTDFTAIGASSNAIGVQFTATDVGGGTTGKAKEVLFYTTGGTQNIEVYVNGVKAVEGSSNDYVATTGTSVTFTSNLLSGDVVDIQVYELLTNDSYYLKTETYTQAEVNAQITTGTSSYLPLSGGNMTGNVSMNNNVELRSFDTGGAARTMARITSSDEFELGWSGSGPVKFMGGSSYTERLRIHTDGRVGINTTTNPPDALLHVQHTNTDEAFIVANRYNDTSSGTDFRPIFAVSEVPDPTTTSTVIGNHNRTIHIGSAFGVTGQADLASNNLLTILSSGRVGIGNTAPNHTLEVEGTIAVKGERSPITPVLTLDFARSKKLDSRIQFQRPSIGSYYNSGGIIEYAPPNTPRFDHDPVTGKSLGLLMEDNITNRVLSNYPNNSQWYIDSAGVQVISNCAISPDGKMNAHGAFTFGPAGGHTLRVDSSLGSHASTDIRCATVYAKAGNLPGIQVRLMNNAGSFSYHIVNFNITDGTVYSNSSHQAANLSHRIDYVGNGWYRCEVKCSFTDSAVTSSTIQLNTYDGTTHTTVGSGEIDHYFWGLQLEQDDFASSVIEPEVLFYSRNSRASYYDENGHVKFAPADRPRYSYKWDGQNFVETGLILEAASTNLLSQNETYIRTLPQGGNTWIVQSGSTITPFDETGPDGVPNSATLLTTNSTSGNVIYRNLGGVTNTSNVYTASVYAKANGTSVVEVRLDMPALYKATFDLANGTITQVTDSENFPAYMENVGNGWYRCSISTTANDDITNFVLSGDTSVATTSIWLWGAQVEVGKKATSFIEYGSTRAADVALYTQGTRDVDRARMLVEDFDYNKEEGTVYHEFEKTVYQGNSRLISLDDGTLDARMASQTNSSTAIRMAAFTEGVVGAQVNSSISIGSGETWEDPHKYSWSYKENLFETAFDGATSATDTSFIVPKTIKYLQIGGLTYGYPSNTRHSKIAVYDKALSKSEISALTRKN